MRDGRVGTTAAAVQYRVTADLPPTPTIAGPGGPVTGAFPITITFSEAVTGFTSTDLTVTGGTASGFAGDGTSYSATITPTATGPVTVAIAADAATAVVGTGGSLAAQYAVTADLPDPLAAGITLSPTTVTVREDAGTASYTIVLDTQPAATVRVTPGDRARFDPEGDGQRWDGGQPIGDRGHGG